MPTKQNLPKIYRKSLLYKSRVEYADYCINHVEGCSHGCLYPCYAMMMKKRCGIIKGYQDWIKPKIVANALELLEKEIPKHKKKIKFVHLCFSTDPFMYKQPEVINLTLKIIARLNQDNIRSTVLTKGIYPKELSNKNKYGVHNEYGITYVSLDKKFKDRFEPFSPTILRRINAMKKLHEAGLKTWVSMEPYPTPNLVKQDLLKLLSKISFVDKIIFGKLNYNTKSSQFKNSKAFYNSCAKTVLKFCQKEKIDCHIKFGTQTKKEFKKTKTASEKIFNTNHKVQVNRNDNLQEPTLTYL